MGFAMALIPLIRELRLPNKESERMLTAHLQMFNTHPYLSSPIIGSITRLEEDRIAQEESFDSASIKQSLMASYAAIGDIFFWGALRPFASIISVFLIYMGTIIAPAAFLLVYTPAHLWVRLKGFIEGYRRGKRGFEFIRSLDLPATAVKIRWMTLVVIIAALVWISRDGGYWPFVQTAGFVVKMTALCLVMICFLLIKKGLNQIYIVYGAAVIFIAISWKGLLY